MWICIRIAVIFVRLAMVIGGYTHIGFTHTSRGIIVTRLNKQFFERRKTWKKRNYSRETSGSSRP